MVDRLWTPWRMAYIKGDERHSSCIFCDFPSQGERNDEANLIVARGELCFVILNKFPYNTGHVMVAPFRHTGEWETLTPEELAEMGRWSQRIIEALKTTMGPQGFNVGVNQGIPAGAGIADHVHLHVVPRWGGDTNFMTTVGDTKVLPEALDTTYGKLKPLL
jgi:ATP adenylyltransferase